MNNYQNQYNNVNGQSQSDGQTNNGNYAQGNTIAMQPTNHGRNSNQTGNGGNNNNNLNTGTILDIIREKTANIEQITHQQAYKRGLDESLKSIAKRERNVREATITIKQGDQLKHDDVIQIIEAKWLEKHNEQIAITFWQDKESTYCQFSDQKAKDKFLDEAKELSWPGTPKEAKLRESIKGFLNNNNGGYTGNTMGLHFTRKLVKMEISQVRPNIKMDKLREILDKLVNTDGAIISGIKEGKPHNLTKNRSIYFLTNARGVHQLLGTLDGAIPYSNKETNTRAKLFVKVNAKPWQCRECLTFGHHQCQGKVCNQCGMKGHETKDCKTKTKYCNNCRKRGHKAKDNFCPTYLTEIIKELRKMDIPMEYIEDKKLRTQLINNLQVK